MPHLDPEQLSLLAMYEDWEDADGREHLSVCPECAADYAALRRTVDAVKTTPDTTSLSVPGPHVWAGIHRQLGLADAVQADPLGGPGTTPAEAPAEAAPSNVAAFGPRKKAWWQRTGTWIAAAAAVVLVAAGGIWVSTRPAQPTQLAQAQLTPLAQYSATGSAKVVEAADGSRRLDVTLDKDEARGYQEVWLIAPDLSRLVSLGIMNSDSGSFEVPAGLQLADYPIVDVSDEPVDGNPAHSTVSIVRGTLTS